MGNKFIPGKSLKPNCIMSSAVIAAAGHSQRFRDGDKLFSLIHGIPVLAHTLMAFQNCRAISEIIIVVRDGNMEYAADICRQYNITKTAKIVIGGPKRLLSVMNGVFSVSREAELIAIHDGGRPCVDAETIENTIQAAAKYYAAAPAVPVQFTIKRAKDGVITETIDRESLFEIQTPQVFIADLIKAALTNVNKKGLDVTDDCKAVELLGVPVHLTKGSSHNIKLTTRDDLIIAEAILGVRN